MTRIILRSHFHNRDWKQRVCFAYSFYHHQDDLHLQVGLFIKTDIESAASLSLIVKGFVLPLSFIELSTEDINGMVTSSYSKFATEHLFWEYNLIPNYL